MRPFLILDEPTAHLDGHTAADFQALTANRAALIVTHRPDDFPDLPVVTTARVNAPRDPASAVPPGAP